VDQRRRTAHRLLRLEHGAITLEGLAALAVAFLLLVLLLQVTVAVTARHAAETAVAATARRAARPGADLAAAAAALTVTLKETVPGGSDFTVDIARTDKEVVATSRFAWVPPGPGFGPIAMEVTASALRVIPP
jgi:hypothetical protein